MDNAIYNKLPKKLQVNEIIDIYKDKTCDGVLYTAVLEWSDGFSRVITEYGFKDFKNYLNDVILVNREIQL